MVCALCKDAKTNVRGLHCTHCGAKIKLRSNLK